MTSLDRLNQEWARLAHHHESCATEAWRQVSTTNDDGSDKSEEQYMEDLIWVCEGILSCGGTESC